MILKVRAGIDPGKEGYICVQKEGEPIGYHQMPITGFDIDLKDLDLLVKKLFCVPNTDTFVVMEKVHAIHGSAAGSTWEFSRNVAIMEMALVCNNVPFELVAPKLWQKEMFQGVNLVQKKSSTGKTLVNDTKAMGAVAAKRIFPNEDLRKSQRARLPDHNKVDALLLSEYCRRKHQ